MGHRKKWDNADKTGVVGVLNLSRAEQLTMKVLRMAWTHAKNTSPSKFYGGYHKAADENGRTDIRIIDLGKEMWTVGFKLS